MAAATSCSPSSATLAHKRMLFSAMAALLLLTEPIACHSLQQKLKPSAISAAPSFLPSQPAVRPALPPALSPDIMPVFPSPKGNAGLSPAGSVPTIPSSPSPPNPDTLEPDSAVAPAAAGAASATSAAAASFRGFGGGGASVALVSGGLVLLWLSQLVGK